MYRIQSCRKSIQNLTRVRRFAVLTDPWGCLLLGKHIFIHSTEGTLKILGKILKFRTGSNSVLGCTKLLVIFPSTYITYIFCHLFNSFLFTLSVLIKSSSRLFFLPEDASIYFLFCCDLPSCRQAVHVYDNTRTRRMSSGID